MAAGKAGMALLLPLIVLNFVLYAILLGLAGWALNELIEGKLMYVANPATSYLVIFSVLTGVLGMTSVIAGLQTLRGSLEANAAAAATGLAAWGLTLISLGLASKQIHLGGVHSKKLKALEAFAIIVAFTQLLYLLVPHVALFLRSKSSSNTAPTEVPVSKSDTATV